MQESNTETFEIGWTGIIEDRVKITADVYYSKQNNFVSPLLLQTPLVTLRRSGHRAGTSPCRW